MPTNTKKRWRVLALLLAVCLVLSLVACSGGSGTENNSSASPNSSSESSSTAGDGDASSSEAHTVTDTGVLAATTNVTAEEILSRDFSEPIEISLATYQIQDGLDYNNGNDYYSWWTETFNVHWDITPLTFENSAERLNIWINSGDLTDWAVWDFNAGDAANYVDQGLLKKFPDDWKEKYPNLAAAAACCEANAYYEEKFGGTYFIFRPVFANNFPAETMTNHFSVFLRTDWAEQAGYDLSKNLESSTITISELFDYLQAVKDAGITEYPWYNTASSVGGVLRCISDAEGVGQNAYYKGSDGKYHWGPAEEETGVKEGLRMIKEAYDKGLLYPEFYTLVSPDDQGHFYAAGDAAAMCYNGMATYMDQYARDMKANLDVDFWEDCAVLVVTDDEGVAHDDPLLNYWAVNILSPDIDDATLERLLTIWDYSCTEEGQLRIRLGVPDVDWEYDDDGNPVSLLGDQSLDEKYMSLYPLLGNMIILSDDYSFINPSYTQAARDRVTELYQVRSDVTSNKGETIDWDLNSYSSQAKNLASMNYADEYANLITKEGDFDQNYDQWVQDKMQVIQPVLDELNAAFTQ